MSGSPPKVDGYLTLGQIVGVHGVRGWVKVRSFTDPPDALLENAGWTLVHGSGRRTEVDVEDASMLKDQLRVALAGIEDRNAAEPLVGAWVQVAREALPAPGEREYFRDDLLEFDVVNVEGASLGRLSHYVDLPAGAVMVVRGAAEHWIPAGPSHLRRVDVAARRLVVDWPLEL